MIAFPLVIVTWLFGKRDQDLSVSPDNIAKLLSGFGIFFMISALVNNVDWLEKLKVGGMGMLLTLGGLSWLYYRQRSHEGQHLTQKNEYLDKLFYEIVQKQKGKLTLWQWVTLSKLSRSEAETYLRRKTVEWDALLDVAEDGTITYQFPYS